MPPPPPFVHPRQSLPSDPWSSQGRTSVESKLDAPRLWKPLPTRRCLYLLNLNTIYLLTGGNPGFCQQSLGDSSSSRSGIQRSQLGPGFVAETTFRRGTCQVILQGSGHIFFSSQTYSMLAEAAEVGKGCFTFLLFCVLFQLSSAPWTAPKLEDALKNEKARQKVFLFCLLNLL